MKQDTYDTQFRSFYDDEQHGFFYILPDKLEEGLYYAGKNNKHRIRITREAGFLEYAENGEIKTYVRLVSETGGALDLSPAMGDDNIHSLTIDDCVALKGVSFNALSSLKNLKSLDIPYIKCGIDFSALRSLEELYIDGSDKQVPELHLPELQHLLLRKVKNKDLSLISKLQNLRLLRIYQGSIQTLSGAEYLPNIKKTELAYCRYLQDISAIATLSALTELEVEKCKNITDFSFLKGNVSVKKMLISELDSLDFLPEMKNIEDIFFENVKDGNLHYLLQSKSLKKFRYTSDKKYYTHKRDEFLSLFEKQRGICMSDAITSLPCASRTKLNIINYGRIADLSATLLEKSITVGVGRDFGNKNTALMGEYELMEREKALTSAAYLNKINSHGEKLFAGADLATQVKVKNYADKIEKEFNSQFIEYRLRSSEIIDNSSN